MKCPNCGFNTLDYLETCKKCGGPLDAKPRYKAIYGPSELGGQRVAKIDEKPVGSAEPYISTQPDYETLFEKPSEFEEYEEALEFNLAGVVRRAVALLIDLTVLFGITTIALASGLYFANAGLDASSANFMDAIILIYLLLLLVGSTYFIFLQGFGGKTIGKMILGIRIIRDDGEPIGLGEAFIRWVGYFISTFSMLIGFIWALFDSRGQAWHDKIAGTYVVRE